MKKLITAAAFIAALSSPAFSQGIDENNYYGNATTMAECSGLHQAASDFFGQVDKPAAQKQAHELALGWKLAAIIDFAVAEIKDPQSLTGTIADGSLHWAAMMMEAGNHAVVIDRMNTLCKPMSGLQEATIYAARKVYNTKKN